MVLWFWNSLTDFIQTKVDDSFVLSQFLSLAHLMSYVLTCRNIILLLREFEQGYVR